jgi:predicted RNase H-like HicB family nuclease
MEQIALEIKVLGKSWKEGERWIAGFPSLDVFSFGSSESDARLAAREALEAWLESCVERGTLNQAMDELGWLRPSAGPAEPESPGGHDAQRWEVAFQVPAFQAATLQTSTP